MRNREETSAGEAVSKGQMVGDGVREVMGQVIKGLLGHREDFGSYSK